MRLRMDRIFLLTFWFSLVSAAFFNLSHAAEIRGLAGKCLDVAGSTKIVLSTCNLKNESQRWTVGFHDAEGLECISATLHPDNPSARPAWSDGDQTYGNRPECCGPSSTPDGIYNTKLSQNAAQSYCSSQSRPWYKFNIARQGDTGTMDVTCPVKWTP
jgi:hypothetical protein